MKKTILIVLAAVLLIAALTNPSKADHKEKIRELISDKLSESVDKDNDDLVRGILQIGFVDQLVNHFLNELVRVDNYVFFSVTKIKDDSTTKAIGFGAFGNVFINTSNLKNEFQKESSTEKEISEMPTMEEEIAEAQTNTSMSGRDSLQQLYNDALTRLDLIIESVGSDKIDADRRSQIERLRIKIRQILSNRHASREDLQEANKAVATLNNQLNALENKIRESGAD